MAAFGEGRRSDADGLRRLAGTLAIATAATCFEARAHGGPTGGELAVILAVPASGVALALAAPLIAGDGTLGHRLMVALALAAADAMAWIGLLVLVAQVGELSYGRVDSSLLQVPVLAVLALGTYVIPLVYLYRRHKARKAPPPA